MKNEKKEKKVCLKDVTNLLSQLRIFFCTKDLPFTSRKGTKIMPSLRQTHWTLDTGMKGELALLKISIIQQIFQPSIITLTFLCKVSKTFLKLLRFSHSKFKTTKIRKVCKVFLKCSLTLKLVSSSHWTCIDKCTWLKIGKLSF